MFRFDEMLNLILGGGVMGELIEFVKEWGRIGENVARVGGDWGSVRLG